MTNRRLIVWPVLLVALCGIGFFLYWEYGGIPLNVESHREGDILSRRVVTLRSILFVHSDDKQLLFVRGRRFSGLRGGQPFFLRIPGRRAIVFVQESPSRQWNDAELCYFDLDKNEIHRVRLTTVSLGDGIGYGRDRIRSTDGDIITFEADGTLVSQTIKIDVRAGQILDVENKATTPKNGP